MTTSNDRHQVAHGQAKRNPGRNPGSNPGISFYWYTSWRMLWRDWRGGELTILAIGLIIVIGSLAYAPISGNEEAARSIKDLNRFLDGR